MNEWMSKWLVSGKSVERTTGISNQWFAPWAFLHCLLRARALSPWQRDCLHTSLEGTWDSGSYSHVWPPQTDVLASFWSRISSCGAMMATSSSRCKFYPEKHHLFLHGSSKIPWPNCPRSHLGLIPIPKPVTVGLINLVSLQSDEW